MRERCPTPGEFHTGSAEETAMQKDLALLLVLGVRTTRYREMTSRIPLEVDPTCKPRRTVNMISVRDNSRAQQSQSAVLFNGFALSTRFDTSGPSPRAVGDPRAMLTFVEGKTPFHHSPLASQRNFPNNRGPHPPPCQVYETSGVYRLV